MGLLGKTEKKKTGKQPCPNCGGVGAIEVPKRNPISGARFKKLERCKRCRGSGWK
jgi:DnaJ-class molecular chaperone